ncbi:hypothetical protein [Ornithinimicrobium cavernae]|uniref:hypothetical protein n=1 Tax=Ornithinimicrobium cavernae TaxID=2666047 RepID=UPI000D6854E9|nr:hypothetical protein [Ornithinimicrobium cavernae]
MTTQHTTSHVVTDLLELYLNDHLAGAAAGRARVHRMASAYPDPEIGGPLHELARQLDAEYERLETLLLELGMRRLTYRQLAARALERLGRLKLNGRLLRRSPMTPVLELELMRGAVNAKAGLWELLVSLSPDLGLDAREFSELAALVPRQSRMLEELHGELVPDAFRDVPPE